MNKKNILITGASRESERPLHYYLPRKDIMYF